MMRQLITVMSFGKRKNILPAVFLSPNKPVLRSLRVHYLLALGPSESELPSGAPESFAWERCCVFRVELRTTMKLLFFFFFFPAHAIEKGTPKRPSLLGRRVDNRKHRIFYEK